MTKPDALPGDIGAALKRRADAQNAEDAILGALPDAALLAAVEVIVAGAQTKQLLHDLPVLANAISDADVRAQVQGAVAMLIGLPSQVAQARRIFNMKTPQDALAEAAVGDA